MASMGAADKRLIAPKQLDYRLAQQIVGYGRNDPPPSRVKPVPLSLIGQMHRIATATNNAFELANSDMSVIGFFFLCRPGEYVKATDPDSKSAPFRLCDIEFYIGGRLLQATNAPLDLISRATFVHLTYTDQKNGVRGEKIGHGANPANPDYGCPVRAVARRVEALRNAHAIATTPLYMVKCEDTWKPVTSASITARLRIVALQLLPSLGIQPNDISARSLRPGGAMALLCAQVDTDVIRLIGRWRSDEMLRYLHVQAMPLMANFARAMATHGAFTLLPGHNVASEALPVLFQQQNQH
jgi:hypothetical protein